LTAGEFTAFGKMVLMKLQNSAILENAVKTMQVSRKQCKKVSSNPLFSHRDKGIECAFA